LLWRLCLTKPNKNDTAPNETASSVRASAIKRNKPAEMMGKIPLSHKCNTKVSLKFTTKA